MASLPEDVIIKDILTKLPVKSISRFRCVCKLWNELSKTPKFIKMHHNHAIQNNKFSVLIASYEYPFMFPSEDGYYTIDFDATSSSYLIPIQKHLPFSPETVIITSCDGGLITSAAGDHRGPTLTMICLWNPSTQDYKKTSISSTTFGVNIHKAWSRYGVCYDWKIDDYKLFLIVPKLGDNISSEVWVSRLGSNSWNSIGNIPYNMWQAKVSVKPLNGIIHWIGNTKVIVSFDIVEVRTKEIPTPSCYLEDEFYSHDEMGVHILGEDIYLSVNATYKKRNIDLWVMKDYDGIDSWTKIFSISKDKTTFDRLWPMHYINMNHEILLHGVVGREGEPSKIKDVLVSYDPKSERFVILDIPGIPRHFYVTPFVGCLVSLDSGKFDVNISKVDTS